MKVRTQYNYQTHYIRCSCTLLLKDGAPLSEVSLTMLSGGLFQMGTTVWMKVLPVENVLKTGTVRAWHVLPSNVNQCTSTTDYTDSLLGVAWHGIDNAVHYWWFWDEVRTYILAPLLMLQLQCFYLGRTGYVFSNLTCGQVKLMAIVIGLHGNVYCPNNTGRITFMSNLSCCLVKSFVHMTHWWCHELWRWCEKMWKRHRL